MMGRWRWIALGTLGSLAALLLFFADRIMRKLSSVGNEPELHPTHWLESIPKLPRFRPIDESINVDVAVVGGGITGLTIAWYVKKLDPALRVAIIESRSIGSGTSSRGSGHIPLHLRGYSEAEVSRRGCNLLRQFCDENCFDVELDERVPTLTLHRSVETSSNPVLTGEELQKAINSRYYAAGEEGVACRLHPGKLITSLIEANQQAGVEIYEQSPIVRVQQGNPVWLHANGQRIIAKRVALATNAYAPEMGFARERMLALHHRVIVTRPLTDEEWEVSRLEWFPYRAERGSWFTHTVARTPDRRLMFRHLLGHRAFEQTSWTFSADDIANGQEALLQRYPWIEGLPFEYEWHDVTAWTRDRIPIAGPIDEGMWIAAGFGPDSILESHFYGYLIAHQMLGMPDRDLHMLEPAHEHPLIPGELARSLGMKALLAWERRKDG